MEREVHIETNDARSGSTPHIVRWVLGISLLAAILILSAVWITGAVTFDSTDKALVAAHDTAEEQAFD